SIGHFLDQPGNQQVIDELLARGVTITDAHPPSPRLRDGMGLEALLVDLEVPRITPLRASQLAGAFPDAQALLAAPTHNLVTAGLPAETAAAFASWREVPANAALLAASAAAMVRIEALLPGPGEVAAGPLDGQTVVLTGTLSAMTRDEAKARLEAVGAKTADRKSVG